ncbi:MAG: oligosaccharide flippase family protein [Pseudomonadota bacterium]
MNTLLQTSVRQSHLRPLLTVLSGNSAVAAVTLIRNIFAARLIGAEQFGVAVTLAIVATGIEMASNLGLQQIIVRDARGENPKFQASLQFVQGVRGVFCAVLLYLLAPVCAHFFGLDDLIWAFRLAALAPLAAGFAHLDAYRYQRNSRFGPSIAISLGPALLSLLLVLPLFQKFGDFRVLLISGLIQSFGTLIMSHLVAERRFTCTLSARHWNSIWRFGSPLALNGLLLLGVFHGEKILVAHLRSPGELAILAMGFTLTLTPALILGRSLQAYALPRLSQIAEQREFQTQSRNLIVLCIGIAFAATVFMSATSSAIPLLLGGEFLPLQVLFPLLALLHGLRIARSGPSIVALAKGNTFNAVLGNMPRVAALPAVYFWLTSGGGFAGLLWIAIVAEAIGLALCILRLRQNLFKS